MLSIICKVCLIKLICRFKKPQRGVEIEGLWDVEESWSLSTGRVRDPLEEEKYERRQES